MKKQKALESKIVELKGSLPSSYAFASRELRKATDLYGSGCIVSITALDGTPIIIPVMIRDGISKEAVAALKADIVRSFEQSIELKPIG